MIELTATIYKGQISELAKLKGMANRATVSILQESHEAGHLKFLGFAGGRGADKRWHGVLRFEPCVSGSCPVAAFDFLKPARPQATKATKGARSEHK